MSIISITDKGKTITYHAHHMRDVIEPVKQYGMFGEQLNAKKKLHTLTFYTEDYSSRICRTGLPTFGIGVETRHHRDERARSNRCQLSWRSRRNPQKHG